VITKTLNALTVCHIIDSVLEKNPQAQPDRILALFKPDSKNYHRAWGCLVAKGLIQDPELEEFFIAAE